MEVQLCSAISIVVWQTLSPRPRCFRKQQQHPVVPLKQVRIRDTVCIRRILGKNTHFSDESSGFVSQRKKKTKKKKDKEKENFSQRGCCSQLPVITRIRNIFDSPTFACVSFQALLADLASAAETHP
ncbi:uncharacterized protein BDCG_17289 [Blastomyces dermatitidis ER-3]|uniref:Uncharacterized protein n=1 Tax=Ajellomyces dermatitidis (strain ER-3 / ATCC MYA-2586) TaxID=559297 RepID=A0ABX2VXN3_AJEDR|nr:uncharacterized protein BDCG_17289 [Blastomyces dermatitidis ER-3]OAT01919.1 hypothetical protein BDCG_17289 [Blastomyces dermatitidis ER-3]